MPSVRYCFAPIVSARWSVSAFLMHPEAISTIGTFYAPKGRARVIMLGTCSSPHRGRSRAFCICYRQARESGRGGIRLILQKDMLRPSLIAPPMWADAEYTTHMIGSFERTGFRQGLNYYRALPKTFDLTPAFKGTLIYQPSLYILGKADRLCQFFHPGSSPLDDPHKE